jgi:hypothetical protein
LSLTPIWMRSTRRPALNIILPQVLRRLAPGQRRERSCRRAPFSNSYGIGDPFTGQQFTRFQAAIKFHESASAVRPSAQPAAATSSPSALTVSLWKLATGTDLSDTTRARWRVRSWVATPVGQRSVWHCCDWMHPTANIKPRAALHQSAPSAITRAMSNAVVILPEAPSLIRSRRLVPTSAELTKLRPSRSGMPIWSMNSSGAAPVPPSVPSITMKSA